MGSPNTKDKVFNVLSEYPNQIVTAEQISKETGLTIKQVQNAVSNLKSVNKIPIESVIGGKAWCYKTGFSNNNDSPLYEFLANTKSGAILIQDESGTIYRATEIE